MVIIWYINYQSGFVNLRSAGTIYAELISKCLTHHFLMNYEAKLTELIAHLTMNILR
jgi:hypothetical protein